MPKSMPIAVFSSIFGFLGIISVVSTNIEIKYLFVGVFFIVQVFIFPQNFLSILTLIVFLNLGK